MDFTLKTYRQLLQSLQNAGFSFITFSEYIESEKLKTKSEKFNETNKPSPSPPSYTPNPSRFIILRHDVDLLPENSLTFARIQHEMGIKGSYYFRAVPESWDEAIIKEIHALGHEVGYHYEDVDLVKSEKLEDGRTKTEDGRPMTEDGRLNESRIQQINEPLIDAAIISFQHNLEKLRQLVPVKTICMHGSPRSKYDNRDLWKKYNYRDFGIIGEPYFDMDFDDVFYLTDTGRRWDGWKVSVRDKVPQQERWIAEGLVFGSTNDIIASLQTAKFAREDRKERESFANLASPSRPLRLKNYPTAIPPRIMFTFHPQRWSYKPVPWLKELVVQNVKNMVKGFMVKLNS